MYNDDKKAYLIPYFEKISEITFDSLLQFFSTFFVVYSLSLVFIPDVLSKNIFNGISLNQLIFIGMIALLFWLHLLLWQKIRNLNISREKETNTGITLLVMGLFIFTILLLQMLTSKLGLIFNLTNWFIIGAFLILVGITFEFTRLDEELIFWLNENKTIKSRLPITILMLFVFFSFYNLPYFTYILLITPWFDILLKFLYFLLLSILNLVSNFIKYSFLQIKLLFYWIINFLLYLVLVPYYFIANNYRGIIRFHLSLLSICLIYVGLKFDLVFPIINILSITVGIVMFYITWAYKINAFVSSLLQGIYFRIIKVLQQVKQFFVNILLKIRDFIYLVYEKRVQILKNISTFLGLLLILLVLYPIHFQSKELLLLIGILLIYIPWMKEINKFILAILLVVKQNAINILKSIKNFAIETFLYLKSVLKTIKDAIKHFISELERIFSFLIINRIKISRISISVTGFLLVILGYIYHQGTVIHLLVTVFGLIFIYLPWMKEINSYIKRIGAFSVNFLLAFLIWIQDSTQILLGFVKLVFIGIIEFFKLCFLTLANVVIGIYTFIKINVIRILKIVITIISGIFVFSGFVVYPTMPFEGTLLIFIGSLLMVGTFFKEIKALLRFSLIKCYDFTTMLFKRIYLLLIKTKHKLKEIINAILYYSNLFIFYCINWLFIWISIVFGITVALYGLVLGFSGLIDNTGTWSNHLLNFNLLMFFSGVSPFILILLSLGFIFVGILLLRVISEHKENLILKIAQRPQNSNRRLNI